MPYKRRNVSTSLSDSEFEAFSIRASELGHEAFAPYIRALIVREGGAWAAFKSEILKDRRGDEKREITMLLNRYAKILELKNDKKNHNKK